jgi:hypothetical protein
MTKKRTLVQGPEALKYAQGPRLADFKPKKSKARVKSTPKPKKQKRRRKVDLATVQKHMTARAQWKLDREFDAIIKS